MPQNDGVMAYIDWAYNNGYAVIDVNMPMHIEDTDVCLLPQLAPSIKLTSVGEH